MRAACLFSCVGHHAIGLRRAGISVESFCEIVPWRRAYIAANNESVPIHEDVHSLGHGWSDAEVVVGGPPCQQTSIASAIHGKRSGESLWPEMRTAVRNMARKPEWVVVEQPPGNKTWEAEVTVDLARDGYHVARYEFGASDVGAPYLRRRVFLVASPSLPRLQITRAAIPTAISGVKRAADARGDWSPDKLASIPVDAGSSGEGSTASREVRRERKALIEALGDSNPPHMMEVIGRVIVEAYAHPA